MLIGLKGSKSILTFFSLPSSVTIVPQYTTKPLGGTDKRDERKERERKKKIKKKIIENRISYR